MRFGLAELLIRNASTIKPSSSAASSAVISFVFGSSSLPSSIFVGILSDNATTSWTCRVDLIYSHKLSARLDRGTASPCLNFNGASYKPTICCFDPYTWPIITSADSRVLANTLSWKSGTASYTSIESWVRWPRSTPMQSCCWFLRIWANTLRNGRS